MRPPSSVIIRLRDPALRHPQVGTRITTTITVAVVIAERNLRLLPSGPWPWWNDLALDLEAVALDLEVAGSSALRSEHWSGSLLIAPREPSPSVRLFAQRGFRMGSWFCMKRRLRTWLLIPSHHGLRRTRKVGCPSACQDTDEGPPPRLVRAMLATLT